MIRRLRDEEDEKCRCACCGRTLGTGDAYLKLEDEKICRDCAENLETWQILEMLDCCSVFELFEEKGKTGRIG